MPHFILEHSGNVKTDFAQLFEQCNHILVKDLPADLSHCYSRAIRCETFRVADGADDKAFVHATLKIMPGRTKETLQTVGKNLLETLKKFFSEPAKKLNLAISLEIVELPSDYYFKN
jgi:5-carboxymethyl-2-hydroxymuconate isomerase